MRPDASVAPEQLQRLFTVKGPKGVQEACSCIIANAILAHWQGARVFYSRDHTFYAAVRAGTPLWFSRRAIVAAIDQLVACGLIKEWRTSPSAGARYRSRLAATQKLIEAIGLDNVSAILWQRPPPVILRCRADRRNLKPTDVLNDQELAELCFIAHDVEEHNRFLSDYKISFPPEVAEIVPTGFVKVVGTYVTPWCRYYYRVFNEDLRHGGRWYGPFWQNVPSGVRPKLLIDGEPVVEVDFAACQLRFMFACVGLPDPLDGQIRGIDPTSDLYNINGLARDVVKSAVLIMTNAGSPEAARRALSAKLTSQLRRNRSREAARVLAAVQAHFPTLAPLWCSGMGLRLQRVDSDLCAQVQREMRAQGIPVLSVHDSFITPRAAEQELRAAMQKAFRQTWDNIATQTKPRNSPIESMSFRNRSDHMR